VLLSGQQHRIRVVVLGGAVAGGEVVAGSGAIDGAARPAASAAGWQRPRGAITVIDDID